jgi:hypothetical protein
MENAFYGAVKGVSSSNFVVLAGTAPYGDPPGGSRMQPVTFYQSLFCLSASTLTPIHCSDPKIYFDAIDHHPYGIGGPLQPAINTDDVAVPDIHKITRVLRAAEHAGRVLPRGSKAVWVTEISWDSDPPDPNGVPIEQQARWYEQAMYVLWRQGVDTVLWLQIVDAPPIPNYASTYQSGLFYLDGSPKPSATAIRFPFVTDRIDSSHVQAWGRAPTGGVLTLEVQRAGQWAVIARLRVRTHEVVFTKLPLRGAAVPAGADWRPDEPDVVAGGMSRRASDAHGTDGRRSVNYRARAPSLSSEKPVSSSIDRSFRSERERIC